MSVNEVRLKKAPDAFVVRGTGDPSSRTFCLGDEDHTIGNALRHILMQDSSVGFAGYSVPHPSEPVVQIRIQTVKKQPPKQQKNVNDEEGHSGQQSHHAPAAIEKLKVACQTLNDQCSVVLEKWESLLPEVKEDRIRMEALLLSEVYADDEDEEEEEDDDGGGGGGGIGVGVGSGVGDDDEDVIMED